MARPGFWSRRGADAVRSQRSASGWRSPPLPKQAVIEGGGVEAQLDEAAVVHDQVVFNGLVAGVGQAIDLSAGEGGHLLASSPT